MLPEFAGRFAVICRRFPFQGLCGNLAFASQTSSMPRTTRISSKLLCVFTLTWENRKAFQGKPTLRGPQTEQHGRTGAPRRRMKARCSELEMGLRDGWFRGVCLKIGRTPTKWVVSFWQKWYHQEGHPHVAPSSNLYEGR